jgi:putative acetyltransferase
MPEFRSSRPGDEHAVRALVFSVLEEFGLEPDPAGVDTDLDDLRGFYVEPGGMFDVLVDDDDAIVGTVGLAIVDAETGRGPAGELRKMYLRPDHRGRGLGRAAMERVLAFARARGFSRVELETHSVLSDAIALYRRYGFVEHVAESCARCDGTMVLELGDPRRSGINDARAE